MVNNYIAQSSQIAEQKHKSDPNLADADLFGNLKKQIGERPRGAAKNLLHGALTGLEYGSKLKASDKFNKTMEYIQSVGEDAMRQTAEIEKQNFAKKKAMPHVLAYVENAVNLDPLSRREMCNGILDRYNQDAGTDYKLVSVDDLDPFKMTFSSKAQQRTVDVRDFFAGDEALEKRLAEKTPQFLEQQQRKRKLEDREYNLKVNNAARDSNYKERQLGIMEQKEARKAGELNRPIGDHQELPVNNRGYKYIPLNEVSKKTKEEYEKNTNKQIAGITFNVKAIKNIEKMKEIIKGNPNISSSSATIIANSNEPNWKTQLARKFQNKKDLADAEQLVKLANDLNLAKILDAPGKTATDIFKQAIAKAAPSGNLTQEGFNAIANDWIEVANHNIALAEERALGLRNGVMILDKTGMDNSAGAVVDPQNSELNTNSEETITIRDPDTGETMVIPRKDANVAFASGWVEH